MPPTGIVRDEGAGSPNRLLYIPPAVLPDFAGGAVSITGNTTVGSTLLASPSGFSPTPSNYTYQWFRNGLLISGATAATYALTEYDVGWQISVSVTASHPDRASKTVWSSAITVAQTFTGGTVSITGTAAVGSTLTASASGFSPTPSSYTYQWLRNDTPISGATTSTYVLTTADASQQISVQVTAILPGFASKTISGHFFLPWTSVSAGSEHTCGIRAGTLWCWGYNRYGRLGDGTTTDRWSLVRVID